MKYILKYKVLIFTLIVILLIGTYNVITLREVSNLQKKLIETKIELEDTEKALDKKIILYNEKLNLSRIKENMLKKGMTFANDIIYFEVEKEK